MDIDKRLKSHEETCSLSPESKIRKTSLAVWKKRILKLEATSTATKWSVQRQVNIGKNKGKTVKACMTKDNTDLYNL